MLGVESLFDTPPFSLSSEEKNAFYKEELQKMAVHHYKNCPEYKRIADNLKFDPGKQHEVEDHLFLPVRLFKQFNLASVDKANITKIMASSGTSGQQTSKITLDKTTGINQKKVLAKITSDFIGHERLPMLVLDGKSVLKNRESFSARGAGILGFSILGKKLTYAFDDEMNLDFEAIESFLEKHAGQKILLFGFTFMVWAHFCLALKKLNRSLPINEGILIHGGGWKKLQEQSVSNEIFKKTLEEVSGITRVHNYYGMVEQTGSIFMECGEGHLHCSNYSDILIRRNNFSLCDYGEKGLIELISLLPFSYPGHVIISEDVGELIGEDDCSCGRLGKYFRVHGRIQNAELRGCSDTYTANT